MANEIVTEDNIVRAVRCANGDTYKASTVILTTGTFLRGLMHIGTTQFPGGRLDEPPSNELSDSLMHIGLELGRLKTGTPARLDGATIDYEKTEIQNGDENPVPFSFMNDKITQTQIPCWITYTNEKIHKVIRDNLHQAPLYTGQIKSTGPRYCPSIETKIIRFADKDRHQVFLEPENTEITTIYCNGISTSLPENVQEQILKLLPGTENARIVHYGYAIEYDYCPPIQLKQNMESKKISGLFLAGQVNGTSGYEEAAGQGIIAGINATRKLQNKEPLVLGRDLAYIGVMIDDLLTKGINEPYRMFTSRAEYRLLLRSDNADRRLTQIGKSVGLIKPDRWSRYEHKIEQIEKLKKYLHENHVDGTSLWDILRRPNSELAAKLPEDNTVKEMKISDEALQSVIIDAKYEGYLGKQERLVTGMKNLENRNIPSDLDYNKISHLRCEAKERLNAFKPATLGQASRISGITPADITVIQIHLKKNSHI